MRGPPRDRPGGACLIHSRARGDAGARTSRPWKCHPEKDGCGERTIPPALMVALCVNCSARECSRPVGPRREVLDGQADDPRATHDNSHVATALAVVTPPPLDSDRHETPRNTSRRPRQPRRDDRSTTRHRLTLMHTMGQSAMVNTKGARHGRGEIDDAKRKRIAAWLRYGIHSWAKNRSGESVSIREVSETLKKNHAYISRVLSEAQTPGLEVLIRMCEAFNLNAHRVLFEDPPQQFKEIGSEQLSDTGAKRRMATVLRRQNDQLREKEQENERLRRRLRELGVPEDAG